MALHQIPVKRFNPYNQLGIIHNNALDYFVKNAPADFTLDDILRLSGTSVLDDMKGKDEYNEEDLIKLEGIAGCAFNIMFLPNTCDPNFIPINVDAIIKTGNFNELQSKFIKELLNPSTDLDIIEYRSVVISIESNILNSSLTCCEQFPLLAATAIGKATTLYWKAQIDAGKKSPWWPVIGEPVTADKKWWQYVLADVGGALSGVGGGVIGIVAGAAGGTITEAVS